MSYKQLIFSLSVLLFMLIVGYQQVYALKEYVNDEYNIKFHYPEEWMQISYNIEGV